MTIVKKKELIKEERTFDTNSLHLALTLATCNEISE
tara:strand:+ start:335 stop:442 length:108 start_codon:yes stop_codon:yes gene_type:complete